MAKTILPEIELPETLSPEDTMCILEKMNSFCKFHGGAFNIVITPNNVEARFQTSSGVSCVLGHSFGSPSQIVMIVQQQAQDMFDRIEAVTENRNQGTAQTGREIDLSSITKPTDLKFS